MHRFLIVFVLVFAAGCSEGRQPATAKVPPPDPDPKVINAVQAVRIAEQFVRDNGYTDFVPPDARKLDPESLEFSEDEKAWLAERHHTLRPRALGYRSGSRNDPDGWTVGFEEVKPVEGHPDIGRAVTMDAFGQDVVVQHMGFYLRDLQPRPE